MIDQNFMKVALDYGIFSALFVYTWFYFLRDARAREQRLMDENNKREDRYQEVISTLTEKLSVIDILHDDIKEIKHNIYRAG